MKIQHTRINGILQTRTGAPAGNCLAACMATILGASLRTLDTTGTQWPANVPAWSEYHATPTPAQETAHAAVRRVWTNHLKRFGVATMRLNCAEPPPGWSIGTVVNPRGVVHAVVCRDGCIVWDPNPKQDSYDCEVLDWEVFLVLDPRFIDLTKYRQSTYEQEQL